MCWVTDWGFPQSAYGSDCRYTPEEPIIRAGRLHDNDKVHSYELLGPGLAYSPLSLEP